MAVFRGATDLRGRVDGMHPYSPQPFPIGGVRIDIFAPSPQGTVLVRSTLTGGDGMYYLPGMAPGVYTLVVNGFLQFPLNVYPAPFQDIPPILYR